MSSGLIRGLKILEAVTLQGGDSVKFSALAQWVGVNNKATLSRTLSVLVEEGYLIKSDVGYVPGLRLQHFSSLRPMGRSERLKGRVKDWMGEMSQKHDLTLCLLERVGEVFVCIHRENTDSSPTMQEVGNVNADPHEPWNQLLCAHETEMANGRGGQSVLQHREQILKRGFVFDDLERRASMRRVGLPLFDDQSQLEGILAIGGHAGSFGQRKALALAKEGLSYLKEHP